MVLGILFGVPLVVFLIVHLLSWTGVVQALVNDSLESSFGPGSCFEYVDLEGVSSLAAEKLVLPSRGAFKEPAVTAESVEVEWGLWDLAVRRRVRSVRVRDPRFLLRRDPNGNWNFRLGGGGAARVSIAQLLVRDGSFSLEWGEGRGIKLHDIKATDQRPGAPLPRTISFQGSFPSGSGPLGHLRIASDRTVTGDAEGALDISKDLCEALPMGCDLTGRLGFRIDGRGRKPAAGQRFPNTASFWSRLTPQGVRCSVAAHTLRFDGKDVDIQGSLEWPVAGEPGPIRVKRWRIHTEDVFELLVPEGEYRKEEGTGSLQGGQLRVDVDRVRSLFDPKLLGRGIGTSGDLVLKDISVEVAPGSGSPLPEFEGELAPQKLRLTYPGLGSLPDLTLSARLSSKDGSVRVAEGKAELGRIAKLVFSGAVDLASGGVAFSELLSALILESLEVDLERLADIPAGRRILAGRLNALEGPAPDKAELPFLIAGRFQARALNVESRESNGDSVLSSDGVRLHGLRLLRWPFQRPTPELTLSGEFGAEAGLREGRIRTLSVRGSLRSSTHPPITAGVGLIFEPDDNGDLRPRRAKLDALT